MRGAFTEITESKRMEAQLRQAHKMEAVGNLSGGIAHEFNNILGIVLSSAELAMDDIPTGNPARTFLSEIKNACLRGKRVVRQLLSFSRRGGEEKLPLNMAEIIKESIGFLRVSIPTNIEFKQELEEKCATVVGDPTQIHQVMINLCNNAAQAMEETGGILGIRLEHIMLHEPVAAFDQTLDAGPYVRVSVSDTGHGIPKDTVGHIFEPFFTTKEVNKGSGMGLAVVHGIITEHRGAIKVESRPNVGTTIECYFPVSDLPVVRKADANGRVQKGNERILLVDDEVSLVNLGRLRLERLGYTVHTHTDPVEAMESFRTNTNDYALVITDMTMPRMTGDRLIRELKNLRPGIKSIICTGHSTRIDDTRAARMGADGYVMKPIEWAVLAKTIRTVLDSR